MSPILYNTFPPGFPDLAVDLSRLAIVVALGVICLIVMEWRGLYWWRKKRRRKKPPERKPTIAPHVPI